MKSFWIGVLGVAAGLFFADIAAEVAWRNARTRTSEPYISPYKPMPVPVDSVAGQTHEEIKAQDSQGNAGNPIPLSEPSSSDPRKNQSDALDQKSMEEVKVAREANDIAREDKDIQAELATIGWRTIWSQVALAIIQFFFIWTANEHAAAAARAAEDNVRVTREAFQTTERAYLGIENWRFRNDESGIPIRIECNLFNSGRTPARIVGSAWQVHIKSKLPPPPNFFQVPIDPMIPMSVHPGKDFIYSVELANVLKDAVEHDPIMQPFVNLIRSIDRFVGTQALNTELLKKVSAGTSPLYLGGCLVYETVGLYQIHGFFLHYEAALKRFALIAQPGYNYDIPYDKK